MLWSVEAENHRLPGEWPGLEQAIVAALRYRKATRAYSPEEPAENIFIIGPDGKRLLLDVQPAAT